MSLQPPLAWIEARLFPSPETRTGAAADERAEPTLPAQPVTGADADPGWSPEQLAALVSLAERTAQHIDHSLPIAPGQIRQLKLNRQPTRPVHLLIQRVGPLFVHGWPVTPDVDYASDTDWVLQNDEVHNALHLSTAVVQLWNHMVLPVASLGGCVNQLTDDAWQAMQSVSGPLLASQRPQISMPQTVVSVTELAGYEFVTGAPLIPGSRHLEERQACRALWARWAEESIQANVPGLGVAPGIPVVPPAEATPLELSSERGESAAIWRALALASVVALAVVVVLPPLRSPWDEQISDERSGIVEKQEGVRILVHLAPAAKVADLNAWLTEWGGQVVAGPNETGALTVEVPLARREQAMNTLGSSPIVEKAEIQKP